jgi:hypothetical protein
VSGTSRADCGSALNGKAPTGRDFRVLGVVDAGKMEGEDAAWIDRPGLPSRVWS